jgi:hypothetical protein
MRLLIIIRNALIIAVLGLAILFPILASTAELPSETREFHHISPSL